MSDAAAGPGKDGDAMYAARGLKRSYRIGGGDLPVLRGVDLEIPEGEFLVVKGPSGTGKSTLLQILGLLDQPTAGSLVYRGRELVDASERERTALRATEFAFVFQFYYLLPEFTALENVQMPALIAGSACRALGPGAGRRERRDRARGLLERVGLGQRLGHRPNQLSGGERQRVAIARALMNEPRIVFCDEPTGNLDGRTAAGIHELLAELNESLGQTIVGVTHDEAMARCARRVVAMEDGRVTPVGGGPEAAC